MTRIREGRYCDPKEILNQVGLMTVLAISGGKWSSIRDEEGEAIGVVLPCGTNRTVEITLGFMDTYTVRRFRQIVNGERRGSDIMEYNAEDIYCDQISEVAYQASCWR